MKIKDKETNTILVVKSDAIANDLLKNKERYEVVKEIKETKKLEFRK